MPVESPVELPVDALLLGQPAVVAEQGRAAVQVQGEVQAGQ